MSRVVVAAGAAITIPSVSAIAAYLFPDERPRALTFVLMGMTLATVLGVPRCTFVAGVWGFLVCRFGLSADARPSGRAAPGPCSTPLPRPGKAPARQRAPWQDADALGLTQRIIFPLLLSIEQVVVRLRWERTGSCHAGRSDAGTCRTAARASTRRRGSAPCRPSRCRAGPPVFPRRASRRPSDGPDGSRWSVCRRRLRTVVQPIPQTDPWHHDRARSVS